MPLTFLDPRPSATRALADRFRKRLAGLDHETLLSYAAELSFAHRHTADALLAKRSPLPAWARDEVLLSADLLPDVFATLQMKDNAAASVCQAWKAAWVATNNGRRGLRPIALPELDFPIGGGIYGAAALPDGNLLVQTYENEVVSRIVDPAMKTIRTVECDCRGCVTNDLGLFGETYGTTGLGALQRYDLDTFTMTHVHDSGLAEEEVDHRYDHFMCLTIAPGGLLFALGISRGNDIVCLTARTLKVRHRFGRGMFNDSLHAIGMAAVGNELFVLDGSSKSIRVFSFVGSYLGDISLGDCRCPVALHHFDGRLYLMDGDENYKNTRIIVLTLEGKRLQVWKPDAGREIRGLLCIYGRKLLIWSDGADGESDRLEALQGI